MEIGQMQLGGCSNQTNQGQHLADHESRRIRCSENNKQKDAFRQVLFKKPTNTTPRHRVQHRDISPSARVTWE